MCCNKLINILEENIDVVNVPTFHCDHVQPLSHADSTRILYPDGMDLKQDMDYIMDCIGVWVCVGGGVGERGRLKR